MYIDKSLLPSLRTNPHNAIPYQVNPVPPAVALLRVLGWHESDGRLAYSAAHTAQHATDANMLVNNSTGIAGLEEHPAQVTALREAAPTPAELAERDSMAQRLRAQVAHVRLYERKDLQVSRKMLRLSPPPLPPVLGV